MINIGVEKFMEMIQAEDWERIQRISNIGVKTNLETGFPHFFGYGLKSSRKSQLIVTYAEPYHYQLGRFPEGLIVGELPKNAVSRLEVWDLPDTWNIPGLGEAFQIIDQDGDILSFERITKMLPEAFKTIDYGRMESEELEGSRAGVLA